MSPGSRDPERFEDEDVPWYILNETADIGEMGMSEQHKQHREKKVTKRSIKNYRHATGKWGAALENFSPLWFAVPLSTGGLATLLNAPFPYSAAWLSTLATVLYVFELILFLLFLTIMLTRWTLYPHVCLRRALSTPDELGAYAIPAITLLTLSALTSLQISPLPWAGRPLSLLSYSLWWIGVLWVYSTCVVIWSTLFYTGAQFDRIMTPVLFMAPIGLATAGTEAGLITMRGTGLGVREKAPMLVVAWFCVGVALFMAVILYTMFFHRLMSAGWPKPPKRAGLFMLLGATGQLSTAFQVLGTSISGTMQNFPQYKSSGPFWQPSTALGIETAGILFALLILGFGYLIFCFAIIGVVDVFVRRQATFTLVWWSLVFPTVTFTSAWIELGKSMESPVFRGLGAALTVVIAVVYVLNLGFTARGIINGSLVFEQSQLEMEEELRKKAQSMEKKDGV